MSIIYGRYQQTIQKIKLISIADYKLNACGFSAVGVNKIIDLFIYLFKNKKTKLKIFNVFMVVLLVNKEFLSCSNVQTTHHQTNNHIINKC